MSFFQGTLNQFVLSKEQIQKIVDGMTEEFVEGLSTTDPKNITQQPSFITRLPTGQETGLYLAIDMGGTNLRTAAVHLLGDGKVGVTMEKHEITQELKTGTGEAMFDWIADCTASLLKKVVIDMGNADLHMGVTFSFALQYFFSPCYLLVKNSLFVAAESGRKTHTHTPPNFANIVLYCLFSHFYQTN
jgi:hexokinase